MSSRKAVGSLIGIGFLLMILAVGFSYYEVVNRIERSSDDILLEMAALDRAAADEDLDIQDVALTVGYSLNLTIKNTGNVFSELVWIGVFDDTLNTQKYYHVDESLNPFETKSNIGNSSIVMNPLNEYTIQVLTRYGNVYYDEYPQPVSSGGGNGGGGSNETQYFFVDNTGDAYAPTETGTHSLFSAMQGGPDEIYDTLTEDTTTGSLEGLINNTIVDTLEFDLLKGKTPSITSISGNIYAFAYAGDGDDGFLITVEMTSSGVITNTVIDVFEFDTVKGKTPQIIQVSGDIYAIAYAGNGDDGFLITLDIDTDGTINTPVIDTFEFDTVKGKTPFILSISGDIYGIVYAGNGDDGFLTTVEISAAGTITNTVIDVFEFDTVKGKTPQIIQVSGDVYAIAYAGNGDDGFLITLDIDTDGTINTPVIDTFEFDTTQGKTPEIKLISGDVYAIAYEGVDSDGFLITLDIDTDGAINTPVIDTLEFDIVQGKTPHINQLLDDIYMITYAGGGNDGFLITVEVSAAGAITNTVIDSFEFDTTLGKTPYGVQLGSDVFAVAFEGVDSDGFLITVHFLGGGGDYILDLEVSWSELPSKTNEYLSFYGGTIGTEKLLVDYWDGGSWVTLIPDVTTGWNIVDISTELTGSSFTIRFVDSTQTSDAVQDTWEIDFAYLNLFD